MMKRVAKDYAKRIIGRLREYEYNPDIMKLHVMGGGICILKNIRDFGDAKVNFIEDIRATAKGYEAYAQYGQHEIGTSEKEGSRQRKGRKQEINNKTKEQKRRIIRRRHNGTELFESRRLLYSGTDGK